MISPPASAQAATSTTTAVSNAIVQASAALLPKPLLGGSTSDPAWYSSHIGPVHIYRSYDPGFSKATWQQTSAYRQHGSAPEDYSFNLPPAQLASGADDAKLNTFLATTPKNLIITNQHEPEHSIETGEFTAAAFRASIVHLATLVHAQNARDGGARRVSVILMSDTILSLYGRHPLNYWPGRGPDGENYADLISFDTYALPHATNTAGVPAGFTDGVKWKTAAELLDPSIAFARQIGSRWLVSEFAYLEDVNAPMRRANAIAAFVNYARLYGAVAVEYWDGVGRRADWRLRNGGSNAATAWRNVVNAP